MFSLSWSYSVVSHSPRRTRFHNASTRAYKVALPFIVIKCHIFFMTVGWLLRYAAWARPQGLAQINCSAHGPIKTLPSFNHRWRESPVWPSDTGVRLVLVLKHRGGPGLYSPFGSPLSLEAVICGHSLVTLSLAVSETLNWLSSLPICKSHFGVQLCCFTSTENVRTIRDGEPMTSSLTFSQPLSSVYSGSWLKCCFTSTETVGLLGTGAQDGHLDVHTAPELWKCILVVTE